MRMGCMPWQCQEKQLIFKDNWSFLTPRLIEKPPRIRGGFFYNTTYFAGAESKSTAPLISWYEAENTNL